MDIDELQADWERLGKRDPLWAVLTDPAKAGGRWTPEEFLASGEAEVDTVLDYVARMGHRPRGRALDFGCGAGRLTQALARRMGAADGVDIAAAMLAAAQRLDPPSGVTFHHNTSGDLRLFGDNTFDFVYSNLVLQHMPSNLAVSYMREFVRVAKPAGVIVFQIPAAYRKPPLTLARLAQRAQTRLAPMLGEHQEADSDDAEGALRVYATPEDVVARTLASHGGAVLSDEIFTNALEPDFNGHLVYSRHRCEDEWVSKQYVVLKER